MPAIAASGCSSWPTCRANDSQGGKYMNQRDGSTLPTLTGASQRWGTPRVTTNSGLSCATEPDGKSRLEDQAAYWRTPEASMGEKGGMNSRDSAGNPHLPSQAFHWPTPAASLAQRGSQDRHALDGNNGRNLNAEAKLWTTPQAHDVTERGAGQQPTSKAGNACLARDARMWPTPFGLATPGTTGGEFSKAVEHWPTPTATDSEQAGSPAANHLTLNRATAVWPTPGANDHKGSAADGQRRGQLDERSEQHFPSRHQPTWEPCPCCDEFRCALHAMHAWECPCPPTDEDWQEVTPYLPPALQTTDGQKSSPASPTSRQRLNPGFVCWLMGLPWWWTNPAPISFARREMESFRSALRTHLSLLHGGLD